MERFAVVGGVGGKGGHPGTRSEQYDDKDRVTTQNARAKMERITRAGKQ